MDVQYGTVQDIVSFFLGNKHSLSRERTEWILIATSSDDIKVIRYRVIQISGPAQKRRRSLYEREPWERRDEGEIVDFTAADTKKNWKPVCSDIIGRRRKSASMIWHRIEWSKGFVGHKRCNVTIIIDVACIAETRGKNEWRGRERSCDLGGTKGWGGWEEKDLPFLQVSLVRIAL